MDPKVKVFGGGPPKEMIICGGSTRNIPKNVW